MSVRVPVSVVIAARNEAAQIADCIASVSWAEEIVVVENDSADDTVPRAVSAGATLVFSHPFHTIGAQRNAAIARARCEWILVVDADERGTPELGDEVLRRIATAGSAQAWRVARRNFFLGREIRHGGWERDRPVRLFRRTLRYDERPVHEHVIVSRDHGTLDARLLHHPYASLDEYFEKFNRYSRSWAAQAHAAGRRTSVWQVVMRAPARFVTMYVMRGGWRDGAHGAVLAVLAAMSVAAKYARLWALQRGAPTRNAARHG
jgi:glycosyltransferase involved in cell wall biosynthesis